MMGTTEVLMKNIIKKTAPAIRRQRFMTVSVPQHDEKGGSTARSAMRGDDIGSCVAFNKPQLPPSLGPFVILYLLEMYNNSGEDK